MGSDDDRARDLQPTFPGDPFPDPTAPPPMPAPPGTTPYGAPADGAAPHGAPPYGTAPHGAPPYGAAPHDAAPYGYRPPGAPGGTSSSTVVLTVLSAVLVAFCCGVTQLPALVLGIVGLSRQRSDPSGAVRITRIGWIAFGIGLAVVLAGFVLWLSLVLAFPSTGGVTVSPGGI